MDQFILVKGAPAEDFVCVRCGKDEIAGRGVEVAGAVTGKLCGGCEEELMLNSQEA